MQQVLSPRLPLKARLSNFGYAIRLAASALPQTVFHRRPPPVRQTYRTPFPPFYPFFPWLAPVIRLSVRVTNCKSVEPCAVYRFSIPFLSRRWALLFFLWFLSLRTFPSLVVRRIATIIDSRAGTLLSSPAQPGSARSSERQAFSWNSFCSVARGIAEMPREWEFQGTTTGSFRLVASARSICRFSSQQQPDGSNLFPKLGLTVEQWKFATAVSRAPRKTSLLLCPRVPVRARPLFSDPCARTRGRPRAREREQMQWRARQLGV